MNQTEANLAMRLISENFYPKYMCSIVSWMLIYIHRATGGKARFVALTRENGQGHSICELKFSSKWVMYDVAYNFTTGYSAEQMHQRPSLLEGHPIYKMHLDEFKELFSNRRYVE